jgi:hypothetical protein
MKLDLRKFFTREAIVQSLQTLPELSTPVMDLVFPVGSRVNHPFPIIGYEDLGLPSGNIPVVRRGTQSSSVKPDDGAINFIEPQAVSPSVNLDAMTINNFGMIDQMGQQQLINNRIDILRKICRNTAEALAAQSLTGAIAYWMKGEGSALMSYNVTYGTPATVSISAKWDVGGTTIADIILSLGSMIDKMKEKGYGQKVVFLLGYDVFAMLSAKIAALPNPGIATMTPTSIVLAGGIVLYLMPASYTDLGSGTTKSAVPAKKIVAIDLMAGHKLFYAALDDLDAGFQPMPFFAKPIVTDDPSGIRIVGQSKPLPVVNVKGIVTAQALT